MKVVRKGNPEKLREVLNEISRKRVQVGYFREAQYPDGMPVAYVASIHEFGYPQGNIPARATMRPTAEEKKVAWGRQMAQAVRGAINGKRKFAQGLEAIGAQAAGDIGRAISRLEAPPLKDSTLKTRQSRKKTPGVSRKPLVDTALMIQSVTHVVEDKS